MAAASCAATLLKLCTSSWLKYPNSSEPSLPSTITHPSTSPVPGSTTGTHAAAHGLEIPAKNHAPPNRASAGASARLQGAAEAMTCEGRWSRGLKGVDERPGGGGREGGEGGSEGWGKRGGEEGCVFLLPSVSWHRSGSAVMEFAREIAESCSEMKPVIPCSLRAGVG